MAEDHGRRQSAQKGRRRQCRVAQQARDRQREPAAKDDHRSRAKAGSSGDARKTGIGQGIAENALHDRAGNCKGCADQQTHDHARQPDLLDDQQIARRFTPRPGHQIGIEQGV